MVSYYVDAARTSNGSGTAASPWKLRSDIVWATIATSLLSDAVTVYFSSRATWGTDEEIKIPVSTNPSSTSLRRLTLDGQSQYNLTASGTAVWATETVPGNQATLTNAGGTGGEIVIKNDNSFLTIRGLDILSPTWGGIALGEDDPTLDIHDVLIENCVIDSPVNGQGLWIGYGEAGCYNITFRNNVISNTPLEGVYCGHYNYLSDTITGVVVEYNTLINCGTVAEGDIDIKAGCFGAIIRYNTCYSAVTGGVLAGVVIQSSDCQVYGNAFYDLLPRNMSDGGNGIQINADGAGGTGKVLDNLLVYNNLIYSNAQRGIALYATASGATITNLRMLNNTIVGNGDIGLATSADVSHPITFTAFQNNIVSGNASYAMSIVSGVTFTSLDYNCYDGAGTLFRVAGVNKTWAQWQGLGFDAHGLNTDPLLDGSYVPLAGSPVLGAALDKSAVFTVDKNGSTRTLPWDMGALESVLMTPSDKLRLLAPLLNNLGLVPNAALSAPWTVCGRLTTESGVPVSTTDRTAQGTIYWTPYNGDSVPLYTGSVWTRLTFAEISLALSGLTSGKNYDVFVYNNSGTLALELSAAWTNDTTRADALALQNGLSVKSGATTRLWVGTIRTTGTTTTEDSGGITGTTQVGGKRFVWNRYNQVTRQAAVRDLTDSWSYTSATIRQANGAAGNQVEYISGEASAVIDARIVAGVNLSNSSARGAHIGVGLDSTTTFAGIRGVGYLTNAAVTGQMPLVALYLGMPGLGYHAVSWNENGGDNTCLFFGDNGGANELSGLAVSLWN